MRSEKEIKDMLRVFEVMKETSPDPNAIQVAINVLRMVLESPRKPKKAKKGAAI